MPNLHYENIQYVTVELTVLQGHKELGMTFHDLSCALGYDSTGEERLLRWQECQKIYKKITDIATPATDTTKPAMDTTKPGRHPALAAYEAWPEKTKTFRAKLVQEALRRAKYIEIMAELSYAKMAKADKNLKLAELRELERSTRRKRWSEMVPGRRSKLCLDFSYEMSANRKST